MQSVLAIARTGMSAAQSSLGSSAHNIANLGTNGFRREQVLQVEQAEGGVATSRYQASQPGNELERDVVGQLAAKNAFLANLAVFRTADAMAGSLLSIRA
ncbi:flagellar basal body rod protein [Caldimonas sp. KR1-144]|uniref:flagellar basal body rod protein n=1 Tax=Caldimonas sp. KR1-144 TaxID=3400911 RepID=UPI003BFBDCA2